MWRTTEGSLGSDMTDLIYTRVTHYKTILIPISFPALFVLKFHFGILALHPSIFPEPSATSDHALHPPCRHLQPRYPLDHLREWLHPLNPRGREMLST